MWLTVGGIIAFVGGFALVNYLVMPRAVHHGSDLQVPDVTGLPFETAQSMLIDAGLRVTRAGESPSESVPAGRVLSTDPPVGTPVKAGRMVALTVSLGPELVSVPSVVGQDLRRARILLESSGLTAGHVGYAYSDFIRRGAVIATSPPPDSSAAPGTTVDLRVSLGPPPAASVMPDVRGWRIDGVEDLLREQGLLVAVQRTETSETDDLVVVDQYPPPGSRVAPGDSVLLVAGH
jgi:serine/threonine-protein kinase